MASLKLYRLTNFAASTPINFVTGTSATSTGGAAQPVDKGVEVTFQNQSTSAVNIWIGDSGVVPVIGTTSTLGTGGVILAQNGTYSVGHRHAPSAIQMNEWYMASTSTAAIAFAILVKAV